MYARFASSIDCAYGPLEQSIIDPYACLARFLRHPVMVTTPFDDEFAPIGGHDHRPKPENWRSPVSRHCRHLNDRSA
jgi:hypothetical protein